MKRTNVLILNILLVIVMMAGCVCTVFAQSEEYIPMHTQEELSTLFGRVKDYLDQNGTEITALLDETENQVVTSAYIRSWVVLQYEDATPEQIDDAYEALYNMFLFLGLATDPNESFSTGLLFMYAAQLLDQEYYDLLEESGEDPENIEYAAYLRDIAEALVEDPESFEEEEVEDFLFEIYSETYLAAGLKAIDHTEKLPLPEDVFAAESEPVMMPNPMVEYISTEPLNEMLGIQMPELPEKFNAKVGYYSIIAEIIAESMYELPDDGRVVLRLSPDTDDDISGVYGYEFYEDWIIASTTIEVDTYQTMFIAHGLVKTMDEVEYGFAVDAEGVDEALFYQIVTFFVESCRNQRTAE